MLIFLSKSSFLKNSFRNTIRVSNSLDPDQARHFVGPDLGPNCWPRISADGASRQRVSRMLIFLSKSSFLKNSFRNTIRVSNSLDPDQARHFVGPDLGPNCWPRISADGASRQRVYNADANQIHLCACCMLSLTDFFFIYDLRSSFLYFKRDLCNS